MSRDNITEREIVAAAKALYDLTTWKNMWSWDAQSTHNKWHFIERAYAALRAAREAR